MLRLPAVARAIAFAAGPIAVAVIAYYAPVVREGLARLPHQGDAHFYIYQLARAAEEHGQFWRLADDPLYGRPYPSLAAKHPGLYEGVDLLLIAAVTGPDFDPVARYHLAIVAVLAANGWAAAWVVKRFGGSDAAAAVAVVLVICNHSTAGRLNGHLHLFKHFWVLIATVAFAELLARPTWRAGAALGVAVALALQGSYYFGYFVAVAVAMVWLVHALAGRLTGGHWLAAGVAAVVLGPLGLAATFPVWTTARQVEHSDSFYHRDRRDAWEHGSELWMTVVPPDTEYGRELLAGANRDAAPLLDEVAGTPNDNRALRRQLSRTGRSWEGWNFPGVTAWLGVVTYVAWRLRGRDFGPAAAFCDTAMSLVAAWLLLSLAGGPSAILVGWVPGVRCYGRAGLVAVGVVSAVAPLVLDHAMRTLPGRRWWWVVVIAFAAWDALQGRRAFHNAPPPADPAWCAWLRQQPAGVRLAAFDPEDADRWNWRNLYLRCRHRHAALNGCEPAAYRRPVGEDWVVSVERIERLRAAGFDSFAWPRTAMAVPAGYGKVAEVDGWVFVTPTGD